LITKYIHADVIFFLGDPKIVSN